MADPYRHLDPLATAEFSRLEEIAAGFERAWRPDVASDLASFCPPSGDPLRLPSLVELAHLDLELRLKAGQAARVEDYLDRHPELADDEPAVLGLLAAERELRSRSERVELEEYARRFPHLAAALTARLAADRPADALADETPRFDALASTLSHATKATVPAAATHPQPWSAPRYCGGYELLERIGQGGMGVVYRARHVELGRLAAVKMIRAGFLADRQDVERFRAEARAAARLRHPGIVAVYEVGEADGLLFFAMELVEGTNLAQLARQAPLPADRSAAYVEQIARAIHHAHQAGVVHRDLKPANVLIDEGDRPRVTDFGLAKRVAGDDRLTQTGCPLGTPAYMPPEQAAGSSERVSPAADVYSLGATLYDLLTGRPPFTSDTPWETLQLVKTAAPVRPRLLNPKLSADLETICLTCLEKDPARRYASAADLADELARYLRREPIRARPIGRLRRGARWCRRKPAAAAALALAAGLLLTLAVGAPAIAIREARLRRRADAGFDQARQAVENYVRTVEDEELLRDERWQPLRLRLLTDALAYFRQFIDQNRDNPALLPQLGQALFDVGRIHDAGGSKAEALAAFSDAVEVFDRLVAEFPEERGYQQQLADSLTRWGRAQAEAGDAAAAEAAYLRALSVGGGLTDQSPEFLAGVAGLHANLGDLLQVSERRDEAAQHYRDALAIWTPLLAALPPTVEYQAEAARCESALGAMHYQQGELAEAQSRFEQAHARLAVLIAAPGASARIRGGYADVCANLSAVLAGDPFGKAEEYLAEALATYQALADENPNYSEFPLRLATMRINVATNQFQSGELDAAAQTAEQAAGELEELLEAQLNLVEARARLAMACNILGVVRDEAEDYDRAIVAYRDAGKNLQVLVAVNPDNLDYRGELAGALSNEATSHFLKGDAAAARPLFRQAIVEQRKAFDAAPEVDIHREYLLRHYGKLAICELAVGDPAAAAEACRERKALNPQDPELLYEVGVWLAQCVPVVGQGAEQLTPEQEAERRQYAAEAVAVLREAVAAGFDDRQRLLADENLAPVREDAEFQQLVESLPP